MLKGISFAICVISSQIASNKLGTNILEAPHATPALSTFRHSCSLNARLRGDDRGDDRGDR